MSSTSRYARRLANVEKGLRTTATQPRLAHSAVDDGSIELKDVAGMVGGVVGKQFDGTVTSAAVGGTSPSSPTIPMVTPISGGLRIYWDGTYADGSITRMDFRRVTFHAVTNVSLFNAVDPAQIVGEVAIATGGEVTVSLPSVQHFIFAVAWTDSGKFSYESDPAFGTPISVVDPAMWLAHENSLINLNTVALPALNAELDLNTGAINNLNTVTLPALQAELDLAELATGAANVRWAPTGATTIDGGKITADSVTANEIATNAVTANEIAANAVIANKIAANAVIAGKIDADAITAREIAAATITAAEVAADTITGNQIAAGSITAEEIDVNVLRAGFVLTGAIQVGQATWNPTEGLVIPQPGGTRIHLPADGVTPATLGGNAQLDSATVKGNFNLLGVTNKVSGELKLSNGIVEPTLAPSTYAAWPAIGSSTLDGTGVSWRIYTGMAAHPTNANYFATLVNFGTAAIRYVDRTNGSYVDQSPNIGAEFFADGIGFHSGHYYVYGADNQRSGHYYIYKIRASDWVKVGEVLVSSDPYRHWDTRGTFAVDPGNGECFVAYVRRGTSLLNVNRYNLNLGLVGNNIDFHDFGTACNLDASYVGTPDTGVWTLYVYLEETRVVAAFPIGTLAYSSAMSFSSAGSSQTRGLMYHTGTGRFISFSRQGSIYNYSGWKDGQAVTASYTWYDSNGTVRETREGPVTSYTIPKRAYLVVETATPPDSGNTDPLQVDKANQVGIYVGVGAGLRKLQSRPGIDGSGVSMRGVWLDAISTVTANTPSSNTFIGGTTTTGKITSGAEANGSPLLEISGAGSIKANALTLRGQVMPRVQAGQASGTFPSAAAVDIVITFPVAFAATPAITATGVDPGDPYYTVGVKAASASSVTLRLKTTSGAASSFGFYVNWVAVGT